MSATAVATPKQTLALALEKMKPQVKSALPRGMDEERFIRTVLTLVQKTPTLAECSPASIMLGVMQAAELGLELGTVMGHAYLVPYKGQAQLQIGWRGFIELARRSGEVRGISAEVVYQNDQFYVRKGVKPMLEHTPLLNADRGKPMGAYAVAFFKDGFTDFEWMDLDQIEHCQGSSRASRDDAPWKTHWEEMARKTPIRRLCKRLPLSSEDSALIRAAVLDEYHEAGILEAAPAGVLELETGSPLQSQPPSESPKEASARPIVNFHVGKLLTFINGQTHRIEGGLKALQSQRDEKKRAWTIPASATEDFLKLCEGQGVSAIETNENWEPLPVGTGTMVDLFEGSAAQ